MKRKFRTRISCLLIASLCIGLLSATALAADPVGTEAPAAAETPAPSSGESTGTVEAPTVTEATKTETKSDTPAPGQTTTTTTTEKEWKGTTTEDGTTTTVDGKETTNDTTVTAPDGDLLDQTGTVAGSETTTTTPGAGDPPKKPNTTDVADSKPDGSLEVTVTPGDTNVKAEGNVSAWLQDAAVPEWANDGSLTSERGEDGTVTNIVKDGDTYTKTVTKPDGTVTVETVTLEKDDKGRVTGYTKTTETTGSVTDETVKPEVPDQATVGKDGDTTYSFELPEKPEITTPVQRGADGKPVSGEEVLPLIDTSGSVIGYTKVTYTEGTPSYSDPVLGAYYATTTKIETLENGLQKITTTKTRVTDTSVLEEALSVSDGKWSLSGWMGDVKEGANNGDLTYDTPQPGEAQFSKMNRWEDHLGKVHSDEGSGQPASQKNQLKYSGYGLQSTVMIGYWKTDESGERVFDRTGYVHQFRLIDSEGNPHYAYCADLSILAKADAEYELVNVLDSDYISKPDNRKHLQAIAEKGYWGTASGQGSLDEVKKLVDSKYWNYIDDGIALAVTQAAIWTYGNRNGEKLGGNDFNKDGHTDRFLEFYYSGYDATTGEKFVSTFGDEQWNAAKALYDALIQLQPSDAGNVTDIITKEDIKDATIRVNEKTGTGYKTDLSFKLTVDPSRINGKEGEDDVTLYIYNGDTLLASHKLREATDASGGSGTFTVRYAPETGETIYTVNGLEFTADTSVTLNLSGKQKLNGGAYLFRSDVNGNESQTFIGLVTGDSTRDLNLSVTLGFRVAEPTIEPAASASSRDKHTVTWTASYYTEWPHTPDQPPEEPETPETPETPEAPETPVVPGYDVPKTGDASGLYYVLAIFSALGLALVTCAGRKRRTA